MFTHYYRYKERYQSKIIKDDIRLKIVYPTDEHAMITTGHDFYVIGSFHGINVHSEAELKVELIKLDTGEVVRTVTAGKKDDRAGMKVDYPGIESTDNVETIRSCGMPDLVYDPKEPESFWYTWNKAYYTDDVFAALVYGGTCRLEHTCPYDQNGKKLNPIEAGYYELRVSLDNKDEIISSAKTLWFAEGKKEIILSRFSPDAHVECVKQFVEENEFESFTDPYAGIWDTQYFAIDWPVKAWVEIPARWHFGDAQEYESGTVHFFNYNISEACISWKTEIGTMLAKQRDCVDNMTRLVTYFYKEGCPEQGIYATAAERLEIMPPENYVQITKKKIIAGDKGWQLMIDGICKPLPAQTEAISNCAYEIKNRVAVLDYALFEDGEEVPFAVYEGMPTGVISEKTDAPDENLLLHVKHQLIIKENVSGKKLLVLVTARDRQGNAVEQQKHTVELDAC